MAWAVVATANHYVLDVVAGIVLVLIGHVVALALERRRNRARPAPDVSALAIAHRAGNSLAGLHAGERPRRRRHRVRRPPPPRSARGPAPQDGRAAAVPLGPVGARLGVGPAAGAARSCWRPTGTARRSCSTSRAAGGATGPAVAELLHEVGRSTSRCWLCGRHWPSVEHVAAAPLRAAGAVGAQPGRAAPGSGGGWQTGPPVHGVSVHRVAARPRGRGAGCTGTSSVVMTWPVNDLATLDTIAGPRRRRDDQRRATRCCPRSRLAPRRHPLS